MPFTAGVGENDKITRKKVCEYLGFLEIENFTTRPIPRGTGNRNFHPDSKVSVLVIPTNEELAMLEKTLALVK